VTLPEEYRHNATALPPKYVSDVHETPDIGHYDPNFSAVQAAAPQFSLPSRDSKPDNPHKVVSRKVVVDMFESNLRDFDPTQIDYVERQDYDVNWQITRPRTPLAYISSTPREPLEAPIRAGQHIPPADPLPAPRVPTLDMRELPQRVFSYPTDSNRVYHEAVSQRDRLGPRPATHDISKQMDRDYRPQRNRNVEKLRELEKNHQEFINQFRAKPSARKHQKTPKRPATVFDDQSTRSERLFPEEKAEVEAENFWPFDPLTSRDATQSRPIEFTIGKKPKKPLRGKDFWSFTGGHTRPLRR
jgi:hypothetical protein